MKKILSVVAMTILTTSSFLAQANGKALYNDLGCAACHGNQGKSVIPLYPNLNGQKAAYTIKQLKDFQSGVRKDPSMNAMAALAKGKEKEIADYLAKQ